MLAGLCRTVRRDRERGIAMRDYLLYVDGTWCRGGAGTMTATSPATGESFARVAVADPADVDRAVEAAKAAAPSWAASSAFERAAHCESVVAAIRAPARRARSRAHRGPGQASCRRGLRGGGRAGRVLRNGRRRRKTGRRSAATFHRGGRQGAPRADTDRRRRGRVAVELAIHDGSRGVRPCPRRGQHRRMGAGADHGGLLGVAC